MDRVRNVISAAALASIAGGPLLLVMMTIGVLLSGDPVHVAPDQALQALTVIAMIGMVGWFVAIVPNLLGTAVLGWLGRFNIGMRMPAAWAIIGAAAGGVPAWLCATDYARSETAAAMAGIGAVSALLCRARVRWDDANAAPPTYSALTPAHPQATP